MFPLFLYSIFGNNKQTFIAICRETTYRVGERISISGVCFLCCLVLEVDGRLEQQFSTQVFPEQASRGQIIKDNEIKRPTKRKKRKPKKHKKITKKRQPPFFLFLCYLFCFILSLFSFLYVHFAAACCWTCLKHHHHHCVYIISAHHAQQQQQLEKQFPFWLLNVCCVVCTQQQEEYFFSFVELSPGFFFYSLYINIPV